jgi:acyl-coenzyme A synthetase/AMP-(fatty) acid ligase
MIMMDVPDLDGLLELIATRGVTTLFLPRTLVYLLLAHPKLAETDTSSLRAVPDLCGRAYRAREAGRGRREARPRHVSGVRADRGRLPAHVHDFIDDLPRSPVGKVLKRELRAPYWAGRDREVN